MDFQTFGHLPSDFFHRVERGHRLLKDHGHIISLNFRQRVSRHRQKIFPIKKNLPGLYLRFRFFQPHNGLHRHTFSRTGFTDNADNLAVAHGKAYIVHHGMHTAVCRKTNG